MAKTKKKYFVLCCTSEGAKFVTKVNWSDKVSEWNVNEEPLAMSKEVAHDIALGLTWNCGFCAYVVESDYDVNHPYAYKSGHWEWKWNGKEE